MRAAIYEHHGEPIQIRQVPDPELPPDGVRIRVRATGVCRSDWHAWRGHDPDVRLPHVPGHELAGVVEAAGSEVRAWKGGERVTVPFVCACGRCASCRAGHQEVCCAQTQPGFTHWGSFAELVVVRHADHNLVRLPAELDFAAAASLGCRTTTAWRAVVHRGRARPGQWVAVHGCGGVGLAAIAISVALGARAAGVDVDPAALERARSLGAELTIDARAGDPAEALRAATQGGAHVSLDAIGSPAACAASVRSLRRRGRHVQVGLLTGEEARAAVPMDRVVAHELELLGSHGLAAWRFGELLALVAAGRLDPARLVTRTVDLAEGARVLMAMDHEPPGGVVVIDRF